MKEFQSVELSHKLNVSSESSLKAAEAKVQGDKCSPQLASWSSSTLMLCLGCLKQLPGPNPVQR